MKLLVEGLSPDGLSGGYFSTNIQGPEAVLQVLHQQSLAFERVPDRLADPAGFVGRHTVWREELQKGVICG